MLFFEHVDAIFRGSGRCFWRVWTLFLEGLDTVFGGFYPLWWRVLFLNDDLDTFILTN